MAFQLLKQLHKDEALPGLMLVLRLKALRKKS